MKHISVFWLVLACTLSGAAAAVSNTLAHFADTSIRAIKVDSAGNIYVAGLHGTDGIPESPDAFVAKLSPDGSKISYSTIFGGSQADSVYALDVDSTGAVYVFGETQSSDFPTTPGAFHTSLQSFFPGIFTAKLDPQGKIVYAAVIAGGGTPSSGGILVDASRNVFVSNQASIFKLDATGGKLLASINGLGGRLASDDEGSSYVAGAGALLPLIPVGFCVFGCLHPPPTSGYITKLNASGTDLVYSTFLSGTQSDTIDFAAVTTAGIYISGAAGSSDFPGLDGIPAPCLSPVPQTYETRLNADASNLRATRIVPGNVLAYDSAADILLTWTGTDLIRFDPAAPPDDIACILDAADLLPVRSIAPGELLSIFGRSFAGVAVTLDGIASPLLYVSPSQINIQVPYEIAHDGQVHLTVSSSQTNISASRTLSVVARNPVAFRDTVTVASAAGCSLGLVPGGNLIPLAFNSDGSRNTCSNPAVHGSLVRIFLAGLGLSPDPATPLNPSITASDGFVAEAVSSVPGAISGFGK